MPGIGCLPPTSGLTEVRKRSPRGPDVSFAVTPLEPLNETLCLVNVSPQGSCFVPGGRSPGVPAGRTVAFKPRQLAGHVVQLVTQRAHQFHSLGGIMLIHRGIVAPLASSRRETIGARRRLPRVPKSVRSACGPETIQLSAETARQLAGRAHRGGRPDRRAGDAMMSFCTAK